MLKKTHMIVGVLVAAPVIKNTGLISAIGLIGSTIPDIDYKVGLEHRTITHSLLVLIISTLIIYLIHPGAAAVWGVTYLSHLVLDALTITGVPFMYPFSKKKYGLKLIKTGGAIELYILLSLIYFIVIMITN